MSEAANITVPETLKNHVENCIFCTIIGTNNPDVILEPRVRFILYFLFNFNIILDMQTHLT